MYARGILFGKMKYELGDHSYVRCPENHLVADIEFKTKGYFSGTYNAIGGTIKNEQTGEVLYELSGFWNGEMYLKNVQVCREPTLRQSSHSSIADSSQGGFVRRHSCQTLQTLSAADRRARRTGITTVMAEDCQGHYRFRPHSRYG